MIPLVLAAISVAFATASFLLNPPATTVLDPFALFFTTEYFMALSPVWCLLLATVAVINGDSVAIVVWGKRHGNNGHYLPPVNSGIGSRRDLAGKASPCTEIGALQPFFHCRT